MGGHAGDDQDVLVAEPQRGGDGRVATDSPRGRGEAVHSPPPPLVNAAAVASTFRLDTDAKAPPHLTNFPTNHYRPRAHRLLREQSVTTPHMPDDPMDHACTGYSLNKQSHRQACV